MCDIMLIPEYSERGSYMLGYEVDICAKIFGSLWVHFLQIFIEKEIFYLIKLNVCFGLNLVCHKSKEKFFPEKH